MSEIRYYTVTQEREVKVSAASPIAAALIATEAFANEKGVIKDEGRTTSPIRERDISAREDY